MNDEIKLKINSALSSFIESNVKNTHIEIEDLGIRLYLRNTTRYVDNKFLHTFDLATIDIDEENQNKGYGSQVVKQMIQVAIKYKLEAVFIEGVFSENMLRIVEKTRFKLNNDTSNSNYFTLTR